MRDQRLDLLKPSYEGPESWLWFAGFARIIVLLFAFTAAYFSKSQPQLEYLVIFFGFGLLSSVWYLGCIRIAKYPSSLTTWAQILIDFGVMIATVNFTGGAGSFFTFLFVLVILEVGLLLGLFQAFVFASLATIFMLSQLILPPDDVVLPEPFVQWTNFIVQTMAYFLTAFISGYWNQRVHMMREFQREILDNMSGGFLITDSNGVITAQNKAAYEILKISNSSAIGKRVEKIIRVESGQECPVMTALRSQKDYTSYEFYALTSDDKTKLIGLTTNRLFNTRGHLNGIIASFSDLTEMAKMREELQRQDRMAVVGELAAGLAHEIRNPVAVIRGAVDELQSNLDSEQMVKTLTEIAIRESDHLNDIVTEFFEFAKNPTIRREKVDLRKLINSISASLRHKYAGTKTLNIVLNIPDGSCLVSGDSTRLKQVFVNLSENAIDAMEKEGTLTISIINSAGPIEIRFDDEGCGISPDKIGKIFELFYTTKESGVGMGLAICLKIVTAHDGTIQTSSRENGGTSMRVRLPALS